MAAEIDITELQTKSQAFDLLMTMDETREPAEYALHRAVIENVKRIAV